MIRKEWTDRSILRSDMTVRATHLTKGATDDEAFEKLWTILIEKKLRAGTGYVIGDIPVCCFQDVPLIAIAENLRYEEGSNVGPVRYSPFGIRMNKVKLYEKWGRPVFYGKTEEMKQVIPKGEHWRLVKLNLEDSKNIIDWTHEREWRVKGDLNFEYDEIEVLVKNNSYYKQFVSKCISEDRLDILSDINGIIPLYSVYC